MVNKTEFDNNMVHVVAFDSHYDLYDETAGSFPIDFLFEEKEYHKDWYKKKREDEKHQSELKRQQNEKEKELKELQRLKEKYE